MALRGATGMATSFTARTLFRVRLLGTFSNMERRAMVREEVKERIRKIKERAAYYRSLGADPLSLSAGCSVKVDLTRVVYPAMKLLRPILTQYNIEVAEREDADVFLGDPEELEVRRALLPLHRESDPGFRMRGAARAAVLIQAHHLSSSEPTRFASALEPAYRSLARAAPRVRIGKGHSIITPFKEDEFMLADLVSAEGRERVSIAINNDTMHIIDPSGDVLDPRQVAGAIGNAMNDVFVIGITENLRVLPVINAPSEELRDALERKAADFVKSVGGEVIETGLTGRGRLLMGATVVAISDRQPAQFYNQVKPGMKLVATRPFGELAPITLYMVGIIDETLFDELEQEGISFKELERMKDQAVDIISRPNRAAGEVIARHLPHVGERYDPDEHVAATTDVTGPGIYVVYELAELANASIRLYDFPLLFPEASRLAARHFAMPNATAGTNGGFIIIAPESVSEDMVKELRAVGYSPSIIGEVMGKGRPSVTCDVDMRQYIFDEEVLRAIGQGGQGA